MAAAPGELYLGHLLDPATSKPTGAPFALASHELTTHGVIVGMTGSGKTGLGVVLLEETLSAGIPALILDPKGDMGNLLLSFPSLDPAGFEPWVDPGEALRRGMTPAQLAAETAAQWRQGLASAGIGPERIARLRRGADLRILTPGSAAGIPLNVLGKLSPPALDWEAEGETLRDEIEGLVSGLLVMAGIEPDPLTSPEHILLSNLVEQAWRGGEPLELATLIGRIQQPPLRKLGVFELDAFFPPRDRTRLALRLNGLVASPSFAEWMRGAPLDMEGLLRAPDGRPRASIVYLPHLSEPERVFVVTLLLSKLVTWMRRQPGTSELRALVYADEISGLAPPTAEPPSKRPMLTLFKQARAHGVGMVLATQNPVDMDYKLMANAGTWMVGRLQTERDKARIVEALRSASGDIDVAEWDARIGALGKRQFVLKTARSSRPELFTTRWAISFLRGPLTRPEVQKLRAEAGAGGAATAAPPPSSPPTGIRPDPTPAGLPPWAPDAAPAPGSGTLASSTLRGAAPTLAPDETQVAPGVAPGIPVRYLDPSAPWAREMGVRAGGRRLEAGIALRVRVLFDDTRGDLRHEQDWEAVLFPLRETVDAAEARPVDHDARDFREEAPTGAVYALPRVKIGEPAFFRSAGQAIGEHLFRSLSLTLGRNEALGLFSRVGEPESAFRERCLAAAEERADAESAKLREQIEKRLETARRRMVDAERRVRELEVDTQQRRQQEIIAGAGEVLTMFLGGRRRTRSLAGISSRRSQTVRTRERLSSAEEKLADHQGEIEELERELEGKLQQIWTRWQGVAQETSELEVRLEKEDVHLEDTILFWALVD